MSKPTAHARLEELIFDAMCAGSYYSPLGSTKRAMVDIDAEGIEVIDAADLAILRARLRRVQKRRRELLRIVAGLRDAVVVFASERVFANERIGHGYTDTNQSIAAELMPRACAIRAARKKT